VIECPGRPRVALTKHERVYRPDGGSTYEIRPDGEGTLIGFGTEGDGSETNTMALIELDNGQFETRYAGRVQLIKEAAPTQPDDNK